MYLEAEKGKKSRGITSMFHGSANMRPTRYSLVRVLSSTPAAELQLHSSAAVVCDYGFKKV